MSESFKRKASSIIEIGGSKQCLALVMVFMGLAIAPVPPILRIIFLSTAVFLALTFIFCNLFQRMRRSSKEENLKLQTATSVLKALRSNVVKGALFFVMVIGLLKLGLGGFAFAVALSCSILLLVVLSKGLKVALKMLEKKRAMHKEALGTPLSNSEFEGKKGGELPVLTRYRDKDFSQERKKGGFAEAMERIKERFGRDKKVVLGFLRFLANDPDYFALNGRSDFIPSKFTSAEFRRSDFKNLFKGFYSDPLVMLREEEMSEIFKGDTLPAEARDALQANLSASVKKVREAIKQGETLDERIENLNNLLEATPGKPNASEKQTNGLINFLTLSYATGDKEIQKVVREVAEEIQGMAKRSEEPQLVYRRTLSVSMQQFCNTERMVTP